MSEMTVENPEELLKAYNKLKEDIVNLRADHKLLEKERDELKELSESLSPESMDKMKSRAIKAEIKAQLENDGIKNADRIIKYLDLEGVDYDEEENLVGVDEKLSVIKEDFPELFDVKKRAARSDIDIHASTPANTQKSTTESQVDALFR